MIQDFITQGQNFLFRLIHKITCRKNWFILSTVLALAGALFFAFPGYKEITQGDYPKGWDAVLEKSANPFLNMGDKYGNGSHDSKLTFRLTVPLIAHGLRLGVYGLIILQFCAGVISLGLSVWIGYQFTRDKVIGLLTGLLFAGTYAGTTAFVELRGIFDGIAIFFLLLALSSKNFIIISTAAFLASWTDERGWIALSLVLLYHAIPEPGQKFTLTWRDFVKRPTIAVATGAIGYVVTRLVIASVFSLETSTGGVGLSLFIDQFNQFPMGTWTALEFGWVLVVLSCILLIRFRAFLYVTLYLVALAVIIIVSLSVVDITRSMAYLIPAIFIAIKILATFLPPEKLRHLLLWSSLFTLISANYYAGGEKTIWWQYPLPLQLVRWIVLGK